MICFASPETLYAGYIEVKREYMEFDSREQHDGYLAQEPYVLCHAFSGNRIYSWYTSSDHSNFTFSGTMYFPIR